MPKIIRKVPRIELSEDQELELAGKLDSMVQQAVESRGSLEQDHADFLHLYLGEPREQVKNFPWPNASNVVAPLVRVIIDGLRAQIFDAMLANDPRMVGFERDDLRAAEKLDAFYFQHLWKKVLSLRHIANDWLFNILLDGVGIVKPRFSKDIFLAREEQTEERILTEPLLEGIERATSFEITITERSVEAGEDRPAVDLVDITRLFIAPGTRSSLQYPDCPWYFEETFLTERDLHQRKRRGYRHIDEALEVLNPIEPGDKEREVAQDAGLGIRDRGLGVRTLVFYMRLVLPGEYVSRDGEQKSQRFMQPDGIEEEVVVTYFPEIRRVARIVPLARVRKDGKRPHLVNHYKKIPNFFYSMGVPKALRHMQQMQTALMNQMIDYGTLQNLPFFFYSPSTTGFIEPGRISPGAMIPVEAVADIVSPRLQGDRLFWAQAQQTLQQWWERDSAINDLIAGRSPSLPQAPRTARGQLAQIQQANIAFSWLVSLIAEPFVELLRSVHVLMQQHAPDELEFTLFNQATGFLRREKLTREILKQDVDFIFELNPNRVLERESNIMLFQLLSSLPWIVQNPSAARVLAKQTYESFGKKNFDEIWPETAARIQTIQSGQIPPLDILALEQQQQQPPLEEVSREGDEEEV